MFGVIPGSVITRTPPVKRHSVTSVSKQHSSGLQEKVLQGCRLSGWFDTCSSGLPVTKTGLVQYILTTEVNGGLSGRYKYTLYSSCALYQVARLTNVTTKFQPETYRIKQDTVLLVFFRV